LILSSFSHFMMADVKPGTASSSQVLEMIQDEVSDFYSSGVQRIPSSELTPLVFLRDFVAQNRPVIITEATNDWPSLSNWNKNKLSELLGDSIVHVAVTPDGRGDDVKQVNPSSSSSSSSPETLFVKPWETTVPFSRFISMIEEHEERIIKGEESNKEECVVYLSHQNDSFRQECEGISCLLPPDGGSIVNMGKHVFGGPPEAINLWIGEARAISSAHKDFYENLYFVTRGQKRIFLAPPALLPLLREEQFQSATYSPKSQGVDPLQCQKNDLLVEKEEDKVPWITKRLSVLQQTHPNLPIFLAEVNEGECLFLPSLWYHEVHQSCLTVAVNYWFDMQFNTQFIFYRSIRLLDGVDQPA